MKGMEKRGDLVTGNPGAWFEKPQAQALARDPYLFALIAWLKAENAPGSEFWIANGPSSRPSRLAYGPTARGARARSRPQKIPA